METLQATSRLVINNILFATDFSSTSARAFPFTLAIAHWYGSKVHAVHAVTPEPHYIVPLEPVPMEMEPTWQEAQRKMKQYESSSALGDIQHESVVEHGHPWDVVSRVMRQRSIDLQVVGTHGRTGLRKLVLGSQAESIFRQANCPVLTVGPHVTPASTERWTPKVVLFATDFSAASVHALRFAISIAEEAHADLILNHQMPLIPTESSDPVEIDTVAKLKSLLPAENDLRCRCEFVARVDYPAEGILALAQERNADLIVMGARKKTLPSASAHLPWTTVSEVVGRACCPVLTVRA